MDMMYGNTVKYSKGGVDANANNDKTTLIFFYFPKLARSSYMPRERGECDRMKGTQMEYMLLGF